MVAADRFVSTKLVTPAPTVNSVTAAKLLLVDRWMRNPVSLSEASAQVTVICELLLAIAPGTVGAAGSFEKRGP